MQIGEVDDLLNEFLFCPQPTIRHDWLDIPHDVAQHPQLLQESSEYEVAFLSCYEAASSLPSHDVPTSYTDSGPSLLNNEETNDPAYTKCPDCLFPFRGSSQLGNFQRHWKSKHEKLRIKCPKCEWKHPRRYTIIQHLHDVHDIDYKDAERLVPKKGSKRAKNAPPRAMDGQILESQVTGDSYTRLLDSQITGCEWAGKLM